MRTASLSATEIAVFAERSFTPIHTAQPTRIYPGRGTNPAGRLICFDIAAALRPEHVASPIC